MTTLLPKDRIVDALADELAALDALLTELPDEDWSRPTACPGWDVKANVAHVLGTEAMLAGEPTPEVGVDVTTLPHVRNDIAAVNEAWILSLADVPPAEVLARFRTVTTERIVALRAMDDEAWTADSFTPAGPDTFGRFMRIRVFDSWMHEQDIRDAVDRPGHTAGLPVEVTLDEMTAALGYVVGKRAGAPQGSSVTFSLTGGSDRDIHVLVDGRATAVDELDGPATATLRMSIHSFSRLCGGRMPAAEATDVALAGDTDLGRTVLDNLAYTI